MSSRGASATKNPLAATSCIEPLSISWRRVAPSSPRLLWMTDMRCYDDAALNPMKNQDGRARARNIGRQSDHAEEVRRSPRLFLGGVQRICPAFCRNRSCVGAGQSLTVRPGGNGPRAPLPVAADGAGEVDPRRARRDPAPSRAQYRMQRLWPSTCVAAA